MVGSSSVLRLNFCAENPPLRQAPNRYAHRNSNGTPIFNEYIIDKDGTRILIPLNSLEVEYYIHVKTRHVEVVNLNISKTDLPF